ncbi:hypothetical protein DN752_04295 [Echinicola strongylocentroti]|uniref:Uncharacterized protein n=1 Tax=Echinicola strongylocentroti TaxID=1795355 RepID=A0A2Z4IFP9_9BACT|nr:DUF6252 family protein [Echinicola strongylocentroti]AWW29426.1 hypothetical protein DN752_04295 [Echinicola strongylocentroti]
MKSILYLIILLVFAMCTACDLNFFGKESEPKTELEKLPPITQTGENTFGCLVKGKAMFSKNTLFATAIYQGGFIQIHSSMDIGDTTQNVSIIIPDPFEEYIDYNLSGEAPSNRAKYLKYNDHNECRYEAEDTFDGLINFSRIDKTNFIVSGTFEFSTVSGTCDTVRITDGRFDIKYSP